jgi:hypothetical protein
MKQLFWWLITPRSRYRYVIIECKITHENVESGIRNASCIVVFDQNIRLWGYLARAISKGYPDGRTYWANISMNHVDSVQVAYSSSEVDNPSQLGGAGGAPPTIDNISLIHMDFDHGHAIVRADIKHWCNMFVRYPGPHGFQLAVIHLTARS